MLPSILIVDDEIDVLDTLKRVLRGQYNVHTFKSPKEALIFYKNTPTQLVVSDMKMPEMNGAEFLKNIYEINSRSKRLVLTGYADTELAIQAINEGHVSVYLNKPWDNDELKNKLAELVLELRNENKKLSVIKKLTVDNQRLSQNKKSITTEVEDVQEEYEHSVEELAHLKSINNQLLHLSANLVSMQTHDVTGHTYRIAHQARALSARLNLNELTCVRVYLSALFYQVGLNTLPVELSGKSWNLLTPQERQIWLKFPQASADIIASTDLLKASADMVRHLFENVDGSGAPDHLTQENIPMGSRVLMVVLYFDVLVAGEVTGKIVPPIEALAIMKLLVGKRFDRTVFSEFVKLLNEPLPTEDIELPKTISSLKVGMIVAQDIMNNQDQKILSEKTVLSEALIERLLQYQKQAEQQFIVYVIG